METNPVSDTPDEPLYHGAKIDNPRYDLSGDTDFKQGDTVVHIRDKRLAACMIAVGIPLRKDPPYTHAVSKSGKDIWTFNFYPTDQEGELTASQCIDAWRKDLDFIKENPLHIFSIAMATVKNLEKLDEWMTEKDPVPNVIYRVPLESGKSANLLVRQGSKKHKAAIRRGYSQI